LCSSATRTRQTLDAVIDAFESKPEVEYTERLYSSGLDEYIEIINANKDVKSIMLVQDWSEIKKGTGILQKSIFPSEI